LIAKLRVCFDQTSLKDRTHFYFPKLLDIHQVEARPAFATIPDVIDVVGFQSLHGGAQLFS
jgi:hypothetical protein